MLAFLTSSLGRDVIIGVFILAIFGGAYAYWHYSQDKINSLNASLATVQQQVSDLNAAKTKLESDIEAATAATNTANNQLAQAQLIAQQNSLAIRNATAQLKASAKADPRALEKTINNNQAATLKILQDLSQ